MKKKILIPLILIISLSILFIPFTNNKTSEATYEVNFQYEIKDNPIDGFGVAFDLANTNSVVVLNDDPTFNFAFFFNISLSYWDSGYVDSAFGLGNQPDIWWNSGEVNFTKYGDNEMHFLETRIYGGFNVYIDDMEIGLSKFDVTDEQDTNQSLSLKLSRDEHYLTIIAAEYQLPYVGATIDEIELVVTKIDHVFHVIADAGDPIPTLKHIPINVSTYGVPYSETFPIYSGIPMEKPMVELIDVDTSDLGNITIDYRYNISTDGYFNAYTGLYTVEFDSVGNGTVVWWVNDKPFASSLQSLYGHHNYVYICAISTCPDDTGAWYGGYYASQVYYPYLDFYTAIVDIYIETEITVYEEVTVTTTTTIYEVIPEYGPFSIYLILAFIPTIVIIAIVGKKKRGENNER